MVAQHQKVAALPARQYRDDNGIIRATGLPVDDIPAEMARRGFHRMRGITEMVESWTQDDGTEYAVWAHGETAELLFWLGNQASYEAFMARYLPRASVLDRIFK